MTRTRIIILAALVALAGCVPALMSEPVRGQTAGGFRDLDFDELITSSVQFFACDNLRVADGPVDLSSFRSARGACWNGSGTVIRADGVMLTNSHVAVDSTQREPLWLLVRQTVDARNLPQNAFIGRPVVFSPAGPRRGFGQDDPHLDLAVVVPAFTLDGTPIQPGDVTMRPLPMAEPESVGIGDDLRNIGYPGIGGELITLTQGSVSGFEPDPMVPQLGLVGWIKTDATLGGGISGGTTINEFGYLIGVPTQVGETENREGLGTVGQINHVRPIPEGYNLLLETGTGEGVPPPPSASGQTPEEPGTDTPDEPGEGDVTVRGSIISADTGEPIAGAWFIVLKPGVPVEEFLAGNQEAVFSFSTTNANGEFQLRSPVVRDQGYGVLVIARGFLNMNEDNKVLATADSPAVVTLAPIEMAAQR